MVNSCTVTAEAARKSRQAVRKLRAAHPEAVIVVTGCSAELDRDAFLADGAADVVLSNPEKRSLPELVLEYLAGRTDPGGAARSSEEPITPFRERAFGSFPFRSRAFLKIQEGCNNFCSYCIVPYARGPERSRAFDEVLADCRKAVADGFPELVLTGVNTCAYSDAGGASGNWSMPWPESTEISASGSVRLNRRPTTGGCSTSWPPSRRSAAFCISRCSTAATGF